MKLTQQQRLWLQDYLYQVMEYRETYEEVYDHMLLAIENEPEQEFFESVVAGIIEKDFGGNNGLLQLEEQCKKNAEENTEKQYKSIFRQWFTSPLLVVPLLLFAIQFKLLHIKEAFLWSLLFLLILFIIPGVLLAIRGFGVGYKSADTKRSLKDDISRKLTFRSYVTIWKVYFYSSVYSVLVKYVFNIRPTTPAKTHSSFNDLGFHVMSGFISAFIVLMIVHILSIIKLYRSEFKTQMIATNIPQ